jgi:hypothetical protein
VDSPYNLHINGVRQVSRAEHTSRDGPHGRQPLTGETLTVATTSLLVLSGVPSTGTGRPDGDPGKHNRDEVSPRAMRSIGIHSRGHETAPHKLDEEETVPDAGFVLVIEDVRIREALNWRSGPAPSSCSSFTSTSLNRAR